MKTDLLQLGNKDAYNTWIKRIKDSEARRHKIETAVWKPLLDAIDGPRMATLTAHCEDQLATRWQQYIDTVMPHLLGDQRTCLVTAARVRPGEDAQAKQQLAEHMGEMATALGKAIGLENDPLGRPGVRQHAIFNSLWSVGIVIIGFEPPRGVQTAGVEIDGRVTQITSDMDFAAAQNNEYADAGMPSARVIDPRHFVGDWTFNDFGRGLWFAEAIHMSIADARARWPQFANSFRPQFGSVPTWNDGEPEKPSDHDQGVSRFYVVYHRHPAKYFVIADDRHGPQELLEINDYDLGIEELPLLMLGHQWRAQYPYPKPPLINMHGSAVEENETHATLFAAGHKIKSITIVNESLDPGLAAQIREGSDNGVYTTKADAANVIKNHDAGAIRAELIELSERAAALTEKSSGISDLMLGLREPGNPTQLQTATRQQAISARQATLVKPVRDWESALYHRLLAAIYSKPDLMHGLQLPLGEGEQQQFIAFDRNRPLIGQILDYTVRIETADRFTSADQVQAMNNVMGVLLNDALEMRLNAQGKTVNFVPLIEGLITKSNIPRGGELLTDYQPPPPQPDPTAGGMPIDPAMVMPGPPPEQPQPTLDELYAALTEIPEGDPAEEPILRQIAAMTPVAA